MNDRIRNLLMRYSPQWLLERARDHKKALRRKRLSQQQQQGGWTQAALVKQLQSAGVRQGDSLLVHSSLSKMGYVEGGAQTVLASLLECIGPEGNLLMPSFPASGRNKEYLDNAPVFDVRRTPSAMGKITEVFRSMPGTVRSLHPTDSVVAYGPRAEYFTAGHFGQLTPYTEDSPFRRLAATGGKILMLGTTLNGAGTSLHTLEDAVDFPYPVYLNKIYEVTVIDAQGTEHRVKTKVHNPAQSVKRNCDALKPLFLLQGAMTTCRIGDADCLLLDADKMFATMLQAFKEQGVTMYTPYGTAKKA